MIGIIDCGMGNLGSIRNMVQKLGGSACLVSTPEELASCRKLILPGVGAFDHGMGRLKTLGLIPFLQQAVGARKIPILGICLGAQLMTHGSEEGAQPGLGWIEAKTIRFQFDAQDANLRVPHMGWNAVSFKRPGALWDSRDEQARFYFAHSYHLVCQRPEDVVLTTEYGYEFPSAVAHENIYAVQFHPEKSHQFGMRLFGNFIDQC